MSFTSVTVTGTLENTAFAPVANATVTFQLSAPITDGITLIEPTPLTTTTNSSGQFSIAVLANDDPTTTPKGTSYAVTITASTWTDSWSVIVPHSAAPSVDLFALAVLSPPSTPAQPYVATLEGLNGTVTLSSPNNSLAIGTNGQAVTLQATNQITISQQSASYTFALTDAGTEVDYTGTAAGTFTIPANSSVNFPVGTKIRCRQTNTGALTLAPATGVTLYNGSTTSGSVTLSEEVYLVEITQTAANTWATSWPTAAGGGSGGVTTLEGLSGAVTLSSPNNSVSIGTSGQAVTLQATNQTTISQQSANYTFALTDAGTEVDYTGTSAGTFTIPANSSVNFPVGTTISCRQTNTGVLTIAPASGVTLYNGSTTSGNVTLSEEAYLVRITQTAVNTWATSWPTSLANLGGLPVVENVFALATSGTVTLQTPNAATPDTIQTIAQSGALTLVNWASPAAGQSAQLRIVTNGTSVTFPTTNTRWAGTVSGAGSAPNINAAGTYDFTIKCLDGTNYDWTFVGRFA